MARTLTLTVPESVYQTLLRIAKTPEVLAETWPVQDVAAFEANPLLRRLGSIESDPELNDMSDLGLCLRPHATPRNRPGPSSS